MNAVSISQLCHTYAAKRKFPAREALKGVSFDVEAGEAFGLLGPNGGGKSTLFKILATLIRPTSGRVTIFGGDAVADPASARKRFGIVFQNHSLDDKLTVLENMVHQGHLYGLRGATLHSRIDEMLERYGLAQRKGELAGSLSGGLKRRVELAKGLLHNPELILLDEPTAGLDPAARRDLWGHLKELKAAHNTTLVVATHLMEEADACDRIVLLDQGTVVASGTPATLKSEIGGDVLTIESENPKELGRLIEERFKVKAAQVGEMLRIEKDKGHAFIPQLVEAFPGLIASVSLSKPTLEDAFIHHTGHRFASEAEKENRK